MAKRKRSRSERSRLAKKSIRAERRVVERIGGYHVGGPGGIDGILPDGRPVEVKHWGRSLRPSDVLGIALDPKYVGERVAICAPGGFTRDASRAARDIGVSIGRCRKRPPRP